MKLGILASFCLSAAFTTSIIADDWARPMVATKKIDFGVIATGSEARKLVEIRNVYNQTVHISGVKTTCGCSAATPGRTTIEPGGTGTVEVKMNTHKFRQKKDSNLIIRFDQPRFAELRIPITAYIRTDVVFDPGLVRFNNVDLGEESTSVVNIRYAGRSDWDIVDVRTDNPHLVAQLKPGQRANGRVNYELSVKLDNKAKPGRIRDLITLVTNDKSNPYVPLMVEGIVVPDITVTPSLVKFRPVKAGGTVEQRIVVKGKKPFRIATIDCDGMSDCFEATLPVEKKIVHVVPIHFSAPKDPGQFEDELIIRIAGRTEPLRIRVSGIIN
jgi:type 1 fimbria pilin